MKKKMYRARIRTAYAICFLLTLGAPATTALIGTVANAGIATGVGIAQLVFAAVYAWTCGIFRMRIKESE